MGNQLSARLIRLIDGQGTGSHKLRLFDMRAHRFNQSSIINRISFDDDIGILSVTFKSTGKYLYFDVPKALFEAFCEAEWAGAFFNEQIKSRFRCSRDPERRRFGPNA